MCFSYISLVYLDPLQSQLFSTFGQLWFFLVHFVHLSLVWSIRFFRSTLVLFGPFGLIQSTLVIFGSHWSYLVLFGPFCPLWSYLVYFGSIRSNFVLVSLIWSFSVHIDLIQSTLVSYGPIRSIMSTSVHLVLFSPFCSLWSYSVLFGPLRSYSVHLVL